MSQLSSFDVLQDGDKAFLLAEVVKTTGNHWVLELSGKLGFVFPVASQVSFVFWELLEETANLGDHQYVGISLGSDFVDLSKGSLPKNFQLLIGFVE